MRLFKRNIFVIGTFSLSQLIPELHWFSWESHWGLLIMIHGPSSLFIWRLVDVRWFSCIDKRCVFSRGTFLSLGPSLYLNSFLSYIGSRERAIGDFWLWSMVLLAYLSDDSLVWTSFQVYVKMPLFERNIFVIETFALSLLIPELYWFSWESHWGLLIMIHGPSSLIIWRLVGMS